MQVLNLDADLNISRLDADIRTLRLGEGGTTNYNDLTNKPSINSVTLTGNKTTSDLNIKTSDLINDEGFITNADIPTKTSDLINDSGFQTAAQVSSAVAAAIPTNVSAFTNDAGYITAAQVGNIPTKTSDLTNDSGFITSAEAPVQSVNGYIGAVNLDGSNLDYSEALSINDKIDAVEAAIPTKTSDLSNDSGFITAAGVPSKTSDLINDSGFITSSDIPTDVSAFTNDAGYQTAADVNTLILAAMPVTETIENESIASFSDGADNVPVSSLIVDIDAVQAGSGTPSPSNPRPISGWSECNIHKSGINFWDEEWEIGSIDGTTGANVSYASTLRTKNYIPIIPTLTYYYKSPWYCNARWYDKDKNYLGYSVCAKNYNITIPYNNACYLRFVLPTDYGTTYNNDISINYPATDTDYHAFNGGTDTISLSQTVYGGTLNVKTGVLTITHGYIASYNGETINEPWLSSIDEYVPNTSPSTGAEVVYPLSVPTSAQLTPTEVRTLLGNNNIFADTGNINELVYFKTGCEALARLIEAYT